MIKAFIYILVMITILTIGYKLDFFFAKSNTILVENKPIETSNKETLTEEIVHPIQTKSTIPETSTDNNLSNEIKVLLAQANKLLQESEDEEALVLYNLIIKKIGNSEDKELLEYFANAWMSKALLYQIYPNIDKDAAIEAYNVVIKKFEKHNEPAYSKLFIDAKIQLSRLLPTDERLDIFNDLIKRFENHPNSNIKKEIESLLISKSFELMGKNDEEAMQILDKIIEKYQDNDATTNVPENIRFSILNNIELAIITNNETEHYIDLAEKFISNSPDTKPLIDMLNIIKESQNLNQDEALATWKEEHNDYHFPDWSFQELERWAYNIEDKETKERVSQYINTFVNHKYNIPAQPTEIPITDQPTAASENNENQPTIYEEDPYIQEIYEATGEYPNLDE